VHCCTGFSLNLTVYRKTLVVRLRGSLELIGGKLARAAVLSQLIADLLAFAQFIQAGTLNGADVNENILRAIIGLNETITLLGIEPTSRYQCSS